MSNSNNHRGIGSAVSNLHHIFNITFRSFQIENGELWDELKVLDCINQLRAEHWSYIGNSFPPTVSFGAHASDPEYRPDSKTNVKIGDDILRVSYGSQYLGESTCDISAENMTYNYVCPYAENMYIICISKLLRLR